MRELGLDLGLLLSQIVNFALLALVLYALLFKPVLGKLQERAARIKKGVEDAERAEQLAAEAQKRYDAEIERARREARELLEQANRSAEEQRQQILAHARQEAHELIQRAQQEAQRELQEEQLALRQQMIDLAIAAASRVVQQSLDDEGHHRLVREFLAEAGQLE